MRRLIVAISGASGAIYARRLLHHLARLDVETHVVVSDNGAKVLAHETGIDLVGMPPGDMHGVLASQLGFAADRLLCYPWGDVSARLASGSALIDGMVIVPCSMSTLADLAAGTAANLITRAGAVTLKERRPLIVVPREAPLNRIHLSNMMTLHDAGAVIMPAMPGFYQMPRSLGDLADFMCARILDHLKVGHDIGGRWQGFDAEG